MEIIVYETLDNDPKNISVVLYTLIQRDWEFFNRQRFFKSHPVFQIDILFFASNFAD